MAGKRERRKTGGEPGELNMTAMIDVVFQLLIFFIVTTKPVDVITNLDVFRPVADPRQEQNKPPPKMIRINIFPDGFLINDRRVSMAEMDVLVNKLAAISTEQTILVMCSSLSRHADLVRVLDLCTKYGLKDLSVVSTN
jgi:biopolymer transport protein ExbD